MLMDPTRYWPSASNTLLLRAALHPDPAVARQAWREWEELQRFEAVNWAEMRVFPVVARRLPALGLDSALLPRLVGVRRFLWTKARLLHRAVTPFLERLHVAGITPLLTKGAARIALDPNQASERFSHDVDVLVRPQEWETAVNLLLADGFVADQKLDRDAALRLRQRFHALGFEKDEAKIDLHVFALKRNRCEGDDDGLRDRSLAVHFGGIPVRVPSAEDRVVMAVGHGLLFNPGRVADWAFDAVAAMATPGFDWDLVERELIRRGLAAFGVAALGYLRDILAQPVPDRIIAALERDVSDVFAEELDVLHDAFFSRMPGESAVFRLADLERARRAAAALPPVPPPVLRGTGWLEAIILPSLNSRATRARIRTPGWAGRADRLTLEVTFPAEAPAARQRLVVDLVCFEVHETRLHQRVAPVVDGRATLQFDIPGDFLALRRPAHLEVRAAHVAPDGRSLTTPLADARYRWRSR